MKRTEILDGFMVPNYWIESLKEIFKKECSELEVKMKDYMLKSIKNFPKHQKGYVKNRLTIEVSPRIMFCENIKK